MQVKKTKIVILVTMFFLFSFLSMANAATMPWGDLDKAEELISGRIQTGALVERINNLEKSIFGSVTDAPIISRAQNIVDIVINGTVDKPSLQMTLSAIEWSLLQKITSGTIIARLNNLESMLFGTPNAVDPISKRLDQIVKIALNTGKINLQQVTMPQATQISIKLTQELNSFKNTQGEKFTYEIVNDVRVNNILVIPAGTLFTGTISEAKAASMLARDGKLAVDFGTVQTMDGQVISLDPVSSKDKETDTYTWAAGASTAGLVVFGPAGLIGGAFIKGKDVIIPAGTIITLQTRTVYNGIGLKSVETQAAPNTIQG